VLNKTMQNISELPEQPVAANRPKKTPDDTGIVHIDEYIKITDVESGETLLEARE
jgi:hypothetical protein